MYAEQALFAMRAGNTVLDNLEAVRCSHVEVVGRHAVIQFAYKLKTIAIAAPITEHAITCMCDFVPKRGGSARDFCHG